MLGGGGTSGIALVLRLLRERGEGVEVDKAERSEIGPRSSG